MDGIGPIRVGDQGYRNRTQVGDKTQKEKDVEVAGAVKIKIKENTIDSVKRNGAGHGGVGGVES